MCQDTGTAIVMGKKGHQVWTEGDDEAALSAGIAKAYQETNLRYSQLAPLSMFEEQNTPYQPPSPNRGFRRAGHGLQVHVHGQRRAARLTKATSSKKPGHY